MSQHEKHLEVITAQMRREIERSFYPFTPFLGEQRLLVPKGPLTDTLSLVDSKESTFYKHCRGERRVTEGPVSIRLVSPNVSGEEITPWQRAGALFPRDVVRFTKTLFNGQVLPTMFGYVHFVYKFKKKLYRALVRVHAYGETESLALFVDREGHGLQTPALQHGFVCKT